MKRECKVKRGFFILLAAASVLLFTACTDRGLYPILYTLEKEQPIIDTGMDNEINVYKVVKAGGSYFAAAGQIFSRATGGSEWNAISIPSNAICNTIEYFSFDSKLYAGFYNKANETDSPMGLWKLNGTWGQDSNIASNTQIVMLKESNSQLFISTVSSQVGSLYYYDDSGAFLGSISLPSELSQPNTLVSDITYDTLNTTYWLIAGPYVCSSTDLSAGFSLVTGPTTSGYGGVYYASDLGTPDIYLSAHNGTIYAYNGGSWTASATVETGGKTVKFTEMIGVGADTIFVGTREHGYYDLQGDNHTALFTDINNRRSPDYNIADLYNGAILRFFFDTPSVFACTAGAGLWRLDVNDATWRRE